MRFASDRIGAIRRGDITATLRPFENRPSAYHPADRFHSGLYVIEVVIEERIEVAVSGEPPLELHFVPPQVTYVSATHNIGEYIEVTERERVRLVELDAAAVAALGFEDRDEVIDVFCTDHGGYPEQEVWLIWFRFTADAPRLLAWPNSRKSGGHDDYVVAGNDVLVGEPEAVDSQTQERLTMEAHQEFVGRELKRSRDFDRLSLADRVARLEGAAANGMDVQRALARVRQAVEVGEQRQRRKAA